jgi:hypothetical protein
LKSLLRECIPGRSQFLPPERIASYNRTQLPAWGLIVKPANPQASQSATQRLGQTARSSQKAGKPKVWDASHAPISHASISNAPISYPSISHAIVSWHLGNDGLPMADQLLLSAEAAGAGLLLPSFAIKTGGQSIRHDWLPLGGTTAEQLRNRQHRLVVAINGISAETWRAKSASNDGFGATRQNRGCRGSTRLAFGCV